MAVIRVPSNCQGMTLTTSGAVTATGNLITCTALEATSLASPYQGGVNSEDIVTSNLSTGAITFSCCPVITNITINSVAYPVTNQQFGPVPAVDASTFSIGNGQVDCNFQLVTG